VVTHNMAAMASSILSLASPRSLTICTSSRLTSCRAFSVGGAALWRESSSRWKEGQEVPSTKHGWRGSTWNALDEESPADEERRFSLEEETEKILQGDESQVRGKKKANFVDGLGFRACLLSRLFLIFLEVHFPIFFMCYR
jgi:hypothetical protein